MFAAVTVFVITIILTILAQSAAVTALKQQINSNSSSPSPSSSSFPNLLTLNKIFKQTENPVVHIEANQTENATALGSGFVYDSLGHIITNDHVVGIAKIAKVNFADGSSYAAKVISADPINVIAKKSSTLKQLPSKPTDFPGNDPSVLQIHAFKSVQDSVGQYHIRGEVVNLSNKTLLYPKVSAILFDKSDSPVGSAKPWFVSGLKLIPNSSGTFDLVVGQNELSGKPTSYRLSFTYTSR